MKRGILQSDREKLEWGCGSLHLQTAFGVRVSMTAMILTTARAVFARPGFKKSKRQNEE